MLVNRINCAAELVAFRGCLPAPPFPQSQQNPFFYVDDLPGFRLNMLAAVADELYGNMSLAAERFINQAAMLVLADIKTILFEGFTLQQSLQTMQSPNWDFNSFIGSAPNQTGIVLERNKTCGRMACLHITEIEIAVAAAAPSLTLTIQDGSQITTLSLPPLNPAEPLRFPINITTFANEVRIYLQAGASPYILQGLGSGCGCSGKPQPCYTIKGLDGTAIIPNALGIWPIGFVGCCIDDMLCIWRHQIAEMIQYRTGLLVLLELHTAARVNPETLNVERFAPLIELYEENFKRLLDNWYKSIRYTLPRYKEPCLVCDKPKYSYSY